VTRRSNPDDARSALVAVTEQTVHALTREYEPLNDHLIARLADLAEPDRLVIARFLALVAATIRDVPAANPTRASSV